MSYLLGFLHSWGWTIPLAAAAVTVAAWFFGLGQKMAEEFAKGVGKVLGEAVGNWLKEHVGSLSSFRRRYLEHVYFQHRDFDVKGFAEGGTYALELLNVFVDLSLDPATLREVNTDPLLQPSSDEETERHSIWEFLEKGEQRVAVLGAPGSGKTTLLKYLALACCIGKRSRIQSPVVKCVPIYLTLRKHAKSVAEKPSSVLPDFINDELGHFAVDAPKGWFEAMLAKGRCLVLLDGLDEVADPQLRATIATWVEDQMRQYGKNRFVISSRPYGYRANPLAGVTILQVHPLSPSQVRQFVENWYVANEIKSHRQDDPGVRMKAKSGAEELLGRLRKAPDLTRLTVNPLLLTMIATVHHYRGSLPGSRVELYSEICTVFLGRRRQAIGLDLELRPDQKQTVLEPLAYHMMAARVREIATAQAATLISEALAAVRPSANSVEFLSSIENGSGILVERENGTCAFSHLTFQEYLAAVHARNKGLVQELIQVVRDSWWHETLRLYVAQADGTAILQACLSEAEPGPEALAFAIQCLGDAKTIYDAALRERFQTKIAAGAETDTPEERKTICEALLRLRLTHMTAIDDRFLISSNFTNAEYQLFVDESVASGVFRQPDHWVNYRFPKKQSNGPLVGVRPSDGEAFCEWLSKRDPEGWQYMLPKPPENNGSHITEDLPVGFWARMDGSGPVYTGSRLTNEKATARVLEDLGGAFDIDRHIPQPTSRALARGLEMDFTKSRFDDPNRVAAWKRVLEGCQRLGVESCLDLDAALRVDLRGLEELIGDEVGPSRDLDFALTMERGPDFERATRLIRERDLVQLSSKVGERFGKEVILEFLCWYVRWFSLLLLVRMELQRPAVEGKARQKQGTDSRIDQTRESLLRLSMAVTILMLRLDDIELPMAGVVVVKRRGAKKPGAV